jgi:hypothetical protein
MVDPAKALEMYNQGMTLKSIGDIFNVSRQRAWQIVKTRYDQVTIGQRQNSTKISPRPEEKYVFKQLKQHGFSDVRHQTYGAPFDIEADGLKIEIKYRSDTDEDGQYNFGYLKGREKVDFYILLAGSIKSPTAYIVPGKDIKNSFNIPAFPKNRQAKLKKWLYEDKWEQMTHSHRLKPEVSKKIC